MITTEKNEIFVFSYEQHLTCLRYEKGLLQKKQAFLAEEIRLTLEADGNILGTIQSSAHDLSVLITGYLLSERIINDSSELLHIEIDKDQGRAFLKLQQRTPPSIAVPLHEQCGKTSSSKLSNNNSQLCFSLSELCSYHRFLDTISTSHHRTHGVHEGFIVENGNIIAFAEDIGRHNVLDRLKGIINLRRIDTKDKVLVFSGRVPYSVITKVHHMGFPIILSRAVPTSLGIAYAKAHNITVISGLRPDACNVFTHPERLAEYSHLLTPEHL